MMSDVETKYGIPILMLDRLVACIRTCDRVSDIILYGSRAKGTADRFSDIDITLRGDNLTRSDMVDLEDKIDLLNMPYEVDLSLWNELDYAPLIEEIDKYGIRLG